VGVLCCASLLNGVKEGDGDQQGVISVFVCEENRNTHGQRTCRTTKKYNAQRQRLASRVEQVGRLPGMYRPKIQNLWREKKNRWSKIQNRCFGVRWTNRVRPRTLSYDIRNILQADTRT
jgi:hypothetical protein